MSILSANAPILGFSSSHFTLNTGALATYNEIGQGVFSLEANESELFLVYRGSSSEPIPEPVTWLTAILLAAVAYLRWRPCRAG